MFAVGRPTPPELVEEIRERYRATGGKSPAVGITHEVAKKLEQQLNAAGDGRYRVYVGLRHWHPFIKETYAELLKSSPEQIIGVCMAPQQSSLSTGAYRKKVEEARAGLEDHTPVTYIGSWNRHPRLVAALVENIRQGLQKFPADVRASVPVLFTAHSLPERIVAMKDPYPDEVKGTVEAVDNSSGEPTDLLCLSKSGAIERAMARTHRGIDVGHHSARGTPVCAGGAYRIYLRPCGNALRYRHRTQAVGVEQRHTSRAHAHAERLSSAH